MLGKMQVVALIVVESGVTWGNQKKIRKHFFNPYKKISEFPQHFKDLFMK